MPAIFESSNSIDSVLRCFGKMDDDDFPTYSLDEVEPKPKFRSRGDQVGDQSKKTPSFTLDGDDDEDPWSHLSRAERLDDQTQKKLCSYSQAIALIGLLTIVLAFACLGVFLSGVLLVVGAWGFVVSTRSARLFGEDRYAHKEFRSAIIRRKQACRMAYLI